MGRLIFRNLLQKKGRAFLTLFGLAIATGTLFSLIAFERGYKRGLEHELSQLGAHILVVPKGCPYDAASLALHGANWPCYLKETYLLQVMQTRGVAVAAPVLMASHHQQNREIVCGITPDYLKLRPSWTITGQFPVITNEVLLGVEAARRLGASIGTVYLSAALKREIRVSGILEPTRGPDDDFTFIQLATAQEALRRTGQLTHMLVKVEAPEMLDKTVQALRGCDAGMQMNIVPVAHLFETIRRVSRAAQYVLAALSSIAFIVAGTTLANTMFMAVLERTREIGVLRAIGAAQRQIFLLFAGECVLIGIIGATLGVAGALGLSGWIEGWARSQVAYAPKGSLLAVDPMMIVQSIAFAILVATLAGVIPAIRAMRLPPVEAFRVQSAY